MARRFTEFGGNERGAAAMIFALMAVVLGVLAGLALDLPRGGGAARRQRGRGPAPR